MGHVTHRPHPADGWIGRCRAPCPAHHLQRAGREVLVLDRAARVGHRWRGHWDSLRLYSPAWADGLPCRPYPGPTWHFPSKDEFADYLEQYADELALPVRLGTRVLRVAPSAGSGYAVTADAGHLTADNVVIATGTFGTTPKVPDFADRIDPSIVCSCTPVNTEVPTSCRTARRSWSDGTPVRSRSRSAHHGSGS
ncbi:hypothetical protein FNH13_07365 [Ornithinimicrobium ciconiae]|uniref:NAD(P)/FAD-dependent oxidoreductase n=1 Tax=Ornithinimicrobium ciconiae TaxID=2594265 RepID=A0A516G9H9_9MICO|nr:NAD(P)-binding domain-containing protein [Ornithinimicrobium ciconiae]QDO88184.1 hypothetical protein FNH13_07365 [Ornithinimicrobium ciconiae]